MAWRAVVGLECHNRAEISGELKYSSPSIISRPKVKRRPNILRKCHVTGIVIKSWLYEFYLWPTPYNLFQTTVYNLENVMRISSSNNSSFYFAIILSVCHRVGDPTLSGSLLAKCQLLRTCEPPFLFSTVDMLHGVYCAVLWLKMIKKGQTRRNQ